MLRIEVLTSPDCVPCEALKSLLADVLRETSGEIGHVEFKEVDALNNPEAVVKYGVLAVPAIAINGKLCFTGVPKRRELLDKILEEGRVI